MAKIKGQPKVKPSPSTPSINSSGTITATWTYAKAGLSGKYRAEYFGVRWRFVYVGGKVVYDYPNAQKKIKASKSGKAQISMPSAAKFYPYSGKPRLSTIAFEVRAYNRRGKPSAKQWVRSGAITVAAPKAPTVDVATLDSSTRKATYTITSQSDARIVSRTTVFERLNMYWKIERMDNCSQTYSDWTALSGMSGYSTASSVTKAVDLGSGYGALSYDQWIAIRVTATTRGKGGSTDRSGGPLVEYFAYPAMAVIKSIQCLEDKKTTWNSVEQKFEDLETGEHNGQIVVSFDISGDATYRTQHPVDSVSLEVMRNSDITNAAAASNATSGWTEVTSGDGNSRAFNDTYAASYPDENMMVWYRVKTKRHELVRYSIPVRAKGLERMIASSGDSGDSGDSGTTGSVTILDTEVVQDGTDPQGIKVVYGYNQDSFEGTQFSWADTSNAFNSNSTPTTAKHEGVHALAVTADYNEKYGTTLAYTSHFYITGLTAGSKYWISARRYKSGSSGDVYGPRGWANSGNGVAYSPKPTSVYMDAPGYITEDDSEIEVSWAYSASTSQTGYTVWAYTPKRDESGNVVYVKDADGADTTTAETERTSLAASTEETDSCVVTISKSVYSASIDSGKLVLGVSVSCGGEYADSGKATVNIVKKPEAVCSVDGCAGFVSSNGNTTLTTQQGAQVAYQISQENCVIVMRVIAEGKQLATPDGTEIQAVDEVVYSGVLQSLTVDASNLTKVDWPSCRLINGGKYRVSMIPYSTQSGMTGEEKTIAFTVGWAHEAVAPGSEARISGNADDKSATIVVGRPDESGYSSGDAFSDADVCDIYRVTPDGVALVAKGAKFGTSVVDRFAPFGKLVPLRYRLATRTADGDVEWRDVPYNIYGYSIRFDWITVSDDTDLTVHHLELPYNITYTDKWAKSFGVLRDLEGGTTGYWLPTTKRTADLTTEMVRLGQFADKETLRELATHDGPVFVRTPNGCAYTANVDVTSFGNDYSKMTNSIQFSAEAIDLVDDFKIRI